MDQLNELLMRSANRDADAFSQLYRQASPRLYALCKRLMRDDELAEDVLQEGFVKIWKNAGAFAAGRGSAMTWMTTIVRNQALDKLRMAKSRPVLADEGEYETLEFASAELTPDNLKALSDDTQQLLQCMQQLKPEQRECIMAAFYYGNTHDELAIKMTKPLGTVKAWIRRGIEQLRRCLSHAA
ncbi:MAG: RNA polymerase sigma factor [Thiolinea sp.]